MPLPDYAAILQHAERTLLDVRSVLHNGWHPMYGLTPDDYQNLRHVLTHIEAALTTLRD